MNVNSTTYHILHSISVSMHLLRISVKELVALFVLKLLTILINNKQIIACIEICLNCVSNSHSNFT